jgi:hypothetical protein
MPAPIVTDPPPSASHPSRVLCVDYRVEWDDLQEEVARQWLRGFAVCFFCRRRLGNHRFPARSPFGASCAECGVKLSALVTD